MFRILLLFGLALAAFPASADFYQDLSQLAADDREAAEAQAAALIEQSEPVADPERWLPAFLILWELKKDQIKPAQQTPEFLQKLIDMAKDQTWVLRLQYLQAGESNQDRFIAEAEAANDFRFAAQLLTRQAYDAYYVGDMKLCLSLIQRAFAQLEKAVPHDDLQMLEVKGNMANYLEYTGETRKAEDIYRDVIASYRRLERRWTLADTMANYALLLMHQSRFPEAEKILQEVMKVGLSLRSLLLQGRAHKSLAFASAQQKRYKPAIETYLKGLDLMVKAGEDPVGIADTHRVLADAYVADRQWEKALKELDKAAAETRAMLDKDWERTLQETRVVAYAGLGRTDDALQASKRINQLLVKILEEEKQREISKLKVSLGLQIEEQKNALLGEQNKLQHEKLHDAEILRRFFMGLTGLGALVIVLLLFTLRQTLRAKHSRERMHRILEHIEEGILSIGSGMRVQADFSPYLKRLLDKQDPRDNIFMSLLHTADLSADERDTIVSSLQACIGEVSLAWDFNGAQLPREISLHGGKQHLLLDWQPVYSDHMVIDSVLLTVRDITDRKRLQTEVEEARARSIRLEERFADVMQLDAKRGLAFVDEAAQLMEVVRSGKQIGIPLHTLKGLARSLGFKDMSALVHDMEDAPDAVLLKRLEQMVEEYSALIHKVFQRDSHVSFGNLVDLVASNLGSLRDMLSRAGLELGRMEIVDEVSDWPREWLDAARIFLLHGMTNSVDHGFILPRRRGENVERVARLSVRARLAREGMELELCDNGRGVDLSRLQILAQKMNFQPAAHQTLADVVFVDGASTAEQVSRSSGRGIGMAAVRQAVEQVLGEVHLTPNSDGKGSRLLAYLPGRQIKASSLP